MVKSPNNTQMSIISVTYILTILKETADRRRFPGQLKKIRMLTKDLGAALEQARRLL